MGLAWMGDGDRAGPQTGTVEIQFYLSPSFLLCSFPKEKKTKTKQGQENPTGGVALLTGDEPSRGTQVWQGKEGALPPTQPPPLIPTPRREQAVSPDTDPVPLSPGKREMRGHKRVTAEAVALGQRHATRERLRSTMGKPNSSSACPAPQGMGHFTKPGSAPGHHLLPTCSLSCWPPAPQGSLSSQEAHDRSQCHAVHPGRRS